MSKRIDELELIAEVQEGDLIPLQTSLGTKSFDLGKVNTKITKMATGLGTLHNEMLNNLKPATNALTNKVNGVETAIDNFALSMQNLDAKTRANEAKITETTNILNLAKENLQGQISSLSSSMSNLSETVNEVVNTCESTGIFTIRTRDNATNTTYLMTKIPYTNSNGKRNIIKKYIRNKDDLTVRNFPSNNAINVKAVLAINASAYNGDKINGYQVYNSVALDESQIYINNNAWTLGVKEDGTLKAYKHSDITSSQQLIADGVVNSFCFCGPVLIDGEFSEDFNIIDNNTQRHPRQVIGQTADKTIYIMTCEGRRPNEEGMTLEEASKIMLKVGCVFAYNLDGGGSAQTIWNGSMINVPVDLSEGYVERVTPDILYVDKEGSDEAKIETIRHNTLVDKKYMDLINEIRNYGVCKHTSDSRGINEFISAKEDGTNILNLISPVVNNVNTGIQVVTNNEVALKFSFGETFLRLYNYLAQKTIFKVQNGVITTSKGEMADTQKDPTRITDVHSITGSGFYWCLSSADNNPLNESCSILAIGVANAMSITLTGWRSGKRMYCYQDANGWSEWIEN